jgi:phosphatidylinositol alpha 1,6-mannosyltransferase
MSFLNTDMKDHPRVALFADTFHETNGAANVLRRLKAFAEASSRNFLCVCAGRETRLAKDGPVWTLELSRSSLSLPIDGDLKYDPFLWRHQPRVKKALEEFNPDIIHVTGLNDVSQLGFYFAHFKNINAVASWHTNTHEYIARRLVGAMPWLPSQVSDATSDGVARFSFRCLMRLNFLAQMQLAPNEDLVEVLQTATRRPASLMSRGVDTELFSPIKRRRVSDGVFTLGFVGRLRPEKNVRFLAKIDSALRDAGIREYKWMIVGEGAEEGWLRANLSNAEFRGVLHGEELAAVYADLDLFVFPSRTDAFGNVVLESMASAVPAVVMPDHGPKFLINDGVNGFVAASEEDLLDIVVRLTKAGEVAANIRAAARIAAAARSWSTVFEQLYINYRTAAKYPKDVRCVDRLTDRSLAEAQNV